MNAEFDYTVMQYHAAELRQAAAEQRRALEAGRTRRAERRHRSVFARFLAS
ncbi:hypothetical protein [Nonomuraea phyllanthi]|uniref:hypothetical protein n=1 Tax=Nonomuraea phyllanthi TaxID=2219224 RepID=UPI00186B22E7|nr:hypothetical protein [Nonomuraea phyllanthi]